MMAQEAALQEAANGKLQRLLAYTKSSDVQIGDAALFFAVMNRRSARRWQVPAKIQSQTFKVAETKVEEKDVEDAELDPLQARTTPMEAAPRETNNLRKLGVMRRMRARKRRIRTQVRGL